MGRFGKGIVIVAASASLLWSGFAAAAGLSSSSQTVGAGQIAIGRCDSDGITALPTLSGSSVASVTVSGVAAGCASATVSVGVSNGASSGSGSAIVPAGGGSVTVPITPLVTNTTAIAIEVIIR